MEITGRRTKSNDVSHALRSAVEGATSFCNKFVKIISVFLYVSIGVILILSTKYILSTLNFAFPIFISAIGQLFTSIFVHILVKYKFVSLRPEIVKIVNFRFLMTRIATIGFFATLALILGNYAYLYINVSLIQILKSFTPVVTMILSFIILKLEITCKLILAILILTAGTIITTSNIWTTSKDFNDTDNDEDAYHIKMFGIFIMLCSSLSEALKVVLTQKLLKGSYKHSNNNNNNHKDDILEKEQLLLSTDTDKKCDDIETGKMRENINNNMEIKLTVHESMYYYAPISFGFMVILSLFLEYEAFFNEYDKNIKIIIDNIFLFGIVSILGYGVMISSFFVTKYFSGLYLKALSVCRNFILVMTVVYFGETMTTNQILGYTISMIGFIYYNYIRIHK